MSLRFALFLVALGALATAAWCQSVPGKFDGPAELPRVTVDVRMPRQTGRTIDVREGKDLQEALNSAKCGDTVQLQAGAAFLGAFVLPKKSCDDAHWIVIRTAAPDSELPSPGTRLTPCYSGVESLPGRPALHCKAVKKVTAQILGTTNQGPITFAPGADHYRLIGLELGRVPPNPKPAIVYKVAGPDEGGGADHIILDRVWGHGTPQDEMAHGVRLNGVTNAAVIDSTFTDFHCIAKSGACTDSQAISGGNGDLPSGPFLIENNFLEAAGENILFGGGPGTATPTDITIRRNHLFKPLIWHKGEQGFVGGPDGMPFIVKNNFELKVGTRVLFEGNVLEYSWGGFTQAGFSILLTPRNGAPVPSTQVTDVTIRNCVIRHVGSGMQFGNPAGNPASSIAGERYSIHDVVFEDIDHERYEGHGNLAQVSMGDKPGVPPLRQVKIDHVTAFPPRVLLAVGGPTPPQMTDFVFTNNLVQSGELAVNPTGGPCTKGLKGRPEALLAACFQRYDFRNNVIVGQASVAWPKGNFTARNPDEVGMEKGTARLAANSRFRAKATDAKDVGADLKAIGEATAGVE